MFSKVFENVYEQLYTYLEQNNILYEHRYGPENKSLLCKNH